MDRSKPFNTKKLALGGILTALALLALFFATVLPTNRLSLYALSSFFISIVIIEANVKTGWIFYTASSLLALAVIPDKIGIIPYLIFFGVYGIIKFYIEKIGRTFVEYIFKLIYFNICMVIAIFFIKNLFMDSFKTSFPWWAIVLILEVVFLIYDYVYTLFIQYYREKIKKRLRI